MNVPAPAEVICLERFLENGTFIHDCDMHINTLVPADGFTVVIVTYNTSTDISLPELAEGVVTV